MTVQTVVNPIDNTEVTLIEGVISRIIYKPVNGGVDKFGNTHNASLLIDGDYINFISMKVKEGREPQLQKVSGTAPNLVWTDINEGDTVKVAVKVGEYKGKPQYTTGSSKINIIKKGEGKLAAKSGTTSQVKSKDSTKVFGDITEIKDGVATVKTESGVERVVLADKESQVSVGGRLAANIDSDGNIVSGFKAYGAKVAKDDLGIRVGNSLSVALEAGIVTSPEDITEALPGLVGAIDSLRDELTKANSSMDPYALGARLGQSVVTAARFAKKGTSVDKILETAKVIFDNMNQVEAGIRSSSIKGEDKPLLDFDKLKKEEVKNTKYSEPPLDFDSDIPF